MVRRVFDRQFKLAAVKLIIDDSYSVKEVCHELSIHANTLYRWLSEYETHGEHAFPGNGSALYHTQYKLKILQRENENLREELELLKKFLVFLKKKK